MRKYVKSFPERVGYSDEIKSKYDRRLWKYATEGLQDLTLIAENLPEEIQRKIFNEKYLKLFFKAIFNVALHWQTIDKEGAKMNLSKFYHKRKRMLKICNMALSEIGQPSNAEFLANDVWEIIKQLPSSPQDAVYGTNAIQAIQIEGYRSSRTIEEEMKDTFPSVLK